MTKASDQVILDELVDSVFTAQCFDINFQLASIDGAPTLPDGTSKEECFSWITSLPSHTPPTWIGLGADAEEARAERIAKNIIGKVASVESARSDGTE